MLGARARFEPGDEHGFDLVLSGVGMLAAELRAAHRLPQGAEVERRSQSCRQRLWGVVSHAVIVGRERAGRIENLWPLPYPFRDVDRLSSMCVSMPTTRWTWRMPR